MKITFHIDLYNPAAYGQAYEGDVREVPDDIAKSLIARELASPWFDCTPTTVANAMGPGSISCIMPTRNRRTWIPRAIACFLAQTHPLKELVVLDNGDSIADLIPKIPNIRYMRLSGKQTTGQLRNFACQLAAGEFVAHWDDDDWYHPARLAEQIEAIGGANVCGYRSILFTGEQGVYSYTGAADFACGTSLMYRRTFWERNRFPAVQVAEDTAFVSYARGSLVALDGKHRCVASAHEGNTSPRNLSKTEFKPEPVSALPEGYYV